MEKDSFVKSVSRALQIMDILSNERHGMGVTEIAKQIGIHKSSVYRLLSTLVEYGYVEQDEETERYKLGYKLLEMSSKLLESIDLRKEAKPYLRELEKLTNEVVHLVVYDQGEVIYIEKLDGNETLRMHSKVGKRAPMHCTAVGKAILAHLPKHVVVDILDRKGLPPHTDYTITDRQMLFQELERVRQHGYALDLEENEYGIRCVAVPIFDHTKQVIAAVSVSGPTIRMTNERIEQLHAQMRMIGKQISERLGYR
ncbi:IclR family transcriptional regulator [Anoxybacillus gonensis]|uniref:Glycerol operon regulatory protein n=1 Tax=Anoxybacillus gonensis TaxID=198467 RepID=A0AAW7TGJ3_9BACL|nr:IclR family transcriptional regulator [Anoxybacillus gonensis]AKS38197.1 IclR family transcriptional regulator [Anoxybacillus gonensis]KGP60748.1 IclR family transcriptional regulator [Anoxybacillus gonensis]MCQ5365961.1 IclR family transcriptional regulator [Anoxybacillus gonensis]MDO0877135.1 IclR family transcriptional regulator [Anoxybacillus gonensis]